MTVSSPDPLTRTMGAPMAPERISATRLRLWRWQYRLAPALFLLPAAIMFAVFVVYPIGQSIWTSFHAWDGLGEKTFIGLDNYIRLFQDRVFYTALINNIMWLALFMLAPPIGLAIALFLNQAIMGIRVFKSLFFLPFVISQVVLGLIFSWFYNPSSGLLNEMLGWVGLDPVSPLSDPFWVTPALIVAGIYPQIAYCMILYLTGLNNINPELIDSGRLDGAEGWKLFWHIVLPQLRPATFLAIVVTVIGALRSFDIVAIMTGGGPFDSSQVLAYYMYEQSIENFNMGYGSAIAVILFLIMLAYIAWFLTRMLRQEQRG